jgi:hypothetical protein
MQASSARSSLFQRQRQAGAEKGVPAQDDPCKLSHEMERENDELLGALIGDVRALKANSNKIGKEVNKHNSFLDTVQSAFGAAGSSLNRTTKKLASVSGASSASHIWALFIFAFFVFFFIYLTLRWR